MRAALAGRRTPGDDGAVAVLVSLVFLFVLLPAAALGLSSYVRGGVHAEQVRAADSGALTGAAALTLVNLAVLPPVSSLTVPPNSATLALNRACQATRKAAAVGSTLTDGFGAPPLAGVPGCVATYTPETSFGPCVDVITSALPPVPTITVPPIVIPGVPAVTVPNPIPGQPPIIVTPEIPATTLPGGTASATSIYGAVRNLIPGLLHNGVTVTLNYRVAGPLDAIFGSTGMQDKTAEATARRRFKALLPDLAALTGNPTLTPAQAQLVGALQALIQALKAVVGQTIDPNVVTTTLNQLLPGSPVPTVPVAPFTVLTGACKQAAEALLEDLDDAVKTNPDPTQDLLSCVQQVVLGLNPSFDPLNPTGGLVTVDPNCTDKVFRAEITA